MFAIQRKAVMKKRIIEKITKQGEIWEALDEELDTNPALYGFSRYYFLRKKKSMTAHVAKRVLKHKHSFEKLFENKICDSWIRKR